MQRGLQCDGYPEMPTGHSPRCHSGGMYSKRLAEIAREPTEIPACAVTNILPAPYKGISLCGPSLEIESVRAAVNAGVKSDNTCRDDEQGPLDTEPLIELHGRGHFFMRIGIVTVVWIFAHVIAIALFGWLIGR